MTNPDEPARPRDYALQQELESLREQSSDAGRFNFYHHFSLVLIVLSLATLTASWPR